jgi:hypothetical protein
VNSRIDNGRALENVRDMLNTLTEHGVRCWVQDGTLLGLVRDGRVIPWDHDTDVGAFMSDWTPAAKKALVFSGWTLKGTLGTPDNGLQHRWSRDGIKTDIFFYYTRADGKVWHAAYVSNIKQYRFTYDPFPTKPIETSAGLMLAPDPPEKFLVTKYGSDWRVPKRRWHFARDPKNGRPMK